MWTDQALQLTAVNGMVKSPSFIPQQSGTSSFIGGQYMRIFLETTYAESEVFSYQGSKRDSRSLHSHRMQRTRVYQETVEFLMHFQFRSNIHNAKDLSTSNFWIGYKDEGTGWATLIDKSNYDFRDWNGLEPDGTGNCAVSDSSLGFKWEDKTCASTATNIVCQYRQCKNE